MTEEQAVAVVRDERDRLGLDPDLRYRSARRAIVETTADRNRPGPVAHRVAWLVTFASRWARAEVQIDDATGDVLDVCRST